MDKPKTQLPEEQRQIIRAAVAADVRRMLADREALQEKALTMRRVWAALRDAPQWSIVQNDKPENSQSFDELWSMKPTVTKR